MKEYFTGEEYLKKLPKKEAESLRYVWKMNDWEKGKLLNQLKIDIFFNEKEEINKEIYQPKNKKYPLF